jgi:flagellar basal-body rod protein FlgB
MNGLTVDLIRLGLNAASLRQQAIASNIANASVPGYKRLSVSFEDQMAGQLNALRGADGLLSDLPADVVPVIQEAVSNGGDIAVDVEVANMSQNVLQYETLVKGLSKHFSIMSTAINEGKR